MPLNKETKPNSVTVRNKFDTLQKTSETRTLKDDYESME